MQATIFQEQEHMLPPDSQINNTPEIAEIKHSLAENEELGQAHLPQPLKRYITRGVVGIVFPVALAIYYVWTYVIWLSPSSNPPVDLKSPIPNAKYIWWSWFVLGAIGPNISAYSLAGVEARMLMTTQWRAKNALQLMTHCDKSWGGLTAWAILGKAVVDRYFRKEKIEVHLTTLWLVLFTLSTLAWSFVLSGLTLETGEAFFPGDAPGTSVLGLDAQNFDQRQTLSFMMGVLHRWELGTEPALPLAGSLLAEKGSRLTTNISIPNYLPADTEGHIFLSPQAQVPITGFAWGLALQYNCTEIQKLEDFSILRKRNASNKGIQLVQNIPEDHGCYNAFDDSWICVQNQTMGAIQGGLLTNIQAWMEVGANIQRTSGAPGYPSTYAASESPGLDHQDILEVLVWQRIAKGQGGGGIGVKNPVMNIQEPHVDSAGLAMDAVGVRCTSSSAVGFADVSGVTGTFSDFHRFDAESGSEKVVPGIPVFPGNGTVIQGNNSYIQGLTEIPGNGGKRGNIRRLGVGVSQLLFLDNYIYDYNQFSNWITPLFSSAGFAPVTDKDPATIPGFDTYRSVLQASDLKRSLLLAFKSYALQAIYNGDSGSMTTSDIWTNPNLTSTVNRPILISSTSGVPPLLVLILICLWAVGCSITSAVYGLRKRWSEELDGYSLFCFGRDFARQVASSQDNLFVLDKAQSSRVLVSIPGMIGDALVKDPNVGQIMLVDKDVAVSTKEYK